MVVMLHISQQLEQLNSNLHILTDWLNLGLVLFFCMSGYLYSGREISSRGWYLHRYKEIVIPSIITVILALVIYSLCFEIPEKSIIIYSLISGLGFESFVPNGWMFEQLWFLTYILICYLSVPFIQKIKVKKMSEIQFWCLLILATIVFQCCAFLVKRFLPVPTLSWGVFLRFYLTYFIFRRYEDEKKKKVYKWMTILSILLLLAVCYVRYFLNTVGVFESVAELFFIYSQTIIGTTMFYYLRKLFQIHKFSKKLLRISDKYSYAIYLTHCLFIGYSTSVIYNCGNIVVGIIVALLLTALSSFCVTAISDRLK